MQKQSLVTIKKVRLSFSKDVQNKILSGVLEPDEIFKLLVEEAELIPENGTFFISNEVLILSGSNKNGHIQVEVGINKDSFRVFIV